MAKFTGANVKDVTLKKQSDVVINKVLSTSATVTVDGEDGLEAGSVLVSVDGGKTFSHALPDAEPNGVLCENLQETAEAEVLLMGVVRERYLGGLENAHKEHLFKNKIILR